MSSGTRLIVMVQSSPIEPSGHAPTALKWRRLTERRPGSGRTTRGPARSWPCSPRKGSPGPQGRPPPPDLLGRPVDGAGRGEDDPPDPDLVQRLHERGALGCVVPEVPLRLEHGPADVAVHQWDVTDGGPVPRSMESNATSPVGAATGTVELVPGDLHPRIDPRRARVRCGAWRRSDPVSERTQGARRSTRRPRGSGRRH